jgi:hypothetical protein
LKPREGRAFGGRLTASALEFVRIVTPERRQRIRDLFASVADLTAAEREQALREACGDDDALRAALTRLLE